MAKRPHIIIFNPDEMRADSLHHLGNDASITPNLDEIIKEDAVSFSNTFCQNPVCVPSRCSFMTGQYPHTNGHRTMSYLLHPGEDSILKELKDNGYYVWMNDRNDLTAGQIEGWTESHADEIYYYQGLKKQPKALLNYSDDSRYKYSHYHGQLGLDSDGLNVNADDECIDAAINRLKNPVDDRPMCIFLGLFYPHCPYQVEDPYFSSIDRSKLNPRIRLKDTKDKAPILHAINGYQNMGGLNESEWDEIRATYLGMCSKVDHQFGYLVNSLKEMGIYDDCAIFFLSDHGDYTGDYDLVEKCQNSFEDCLTKVPFLVKPPKGYEISPGINNNLCELVDFYATAMDMAGVTPNHTHFGKSLVKNIANKSLENRKYVFSEGGREAFETHCDEYHADGAGMGNPNDLYYPKKMAQKDDNLHDKGIMIRNDKFKYVSRSKTKDELYDLELDPHELTNVIDDPKYKDIIIELRYELMKWLQRTDDAVPFSYDQRFTKKMMWAKVRGRVPFEHVKEVQDLIDSNCTFGQLLGFVNKLSK